MKYLFKSILSLLRPDPIIVTKRDKPELTEADLKIRAKCRRSKSDAHAYVNVHMVLSGGAE